MVMLPKIIHVVYRETLNQVVESQVLRPAATLVAEDGLDVEAVALTPVGLMLRSNWRSKIEALRDRATDAYGIQLRTPAGLPARIQNQAIDDALLVRALKKTIDPERRNILHCRGAVATRCGLMAAASWDSLDVKVVFDCRADDPAELVAQLAGDPDDPKSWTEAQTAAWKHAVGAEAQVVASADGVVCVSEALKNLLIERHGQAGNREKFSVVPCSVDCAIFSPSSRQQVRAELGLNDKFVVGYVGSVNWYQCIAESLHLFARIREGNEQAHFLGITTDPDPMRRELRAAGIGEADYTIRSVPSSEVRSLVPAIDVGLLIRRDNAVNRVASPVKFGEYLASGVPVITTPSVGDYSATVEGNRLGVVARFPEGGEAISAEVVSAETFDQEMRQRCRRYAEDSLSTRRHASNFRRIYGMAKKPAERASREVLPLAVVGG